jgi:hypothetical protein
MFVSNLHITFCVMYTVFNYLSAWSLTIHPKTGHEGPDVEQTYSCTLYLTSAIDDGGRSTPRPSRLTASNNPVLILQEAGWAPELVWKGGRKSSPLGWEPRTVQPGPRVKFNLNNNWRGCRVAALHFKSCSVLGLCDLLLSAAPQPDMSLHLVAVRLSFSCNFIFLKEWNISLYNSFAFLQAVWAPFYSFIFPSDFCNSFAFLQAVWAPFYSFIFPSDFSDSWLQFLAAITLIEIFSWLKKKFRLCFSIYVK